MCHNHHFFRAYRRIHKVVICLFELFLFIILADKRLYNAHCDKVFLNGRIEPVKHIEYLLKAFYGNRSEQREEYQDYRYNHKEGI